MTPVVAPAFRSTYLRKYRILFFILFYVTIATTITHWVRDSPIILQIEYVFYDAFQRATAETAFFRERSATELLRRGNVVLIDLDSSFINFEIGRIKRARLAQLLDALADHTQPQAIYLHYFFMPTERESEDYRLTEHDKQLISSIKKFKKKIVLPYAVHPFELGFRWLWDGGGIEQREALIYEPDRIGFYAPVNMKRDHLDRYLQLHTKHGEAVRSTISHLLELTHPQNLVMLNNDSLGLLEINYLVGDVSKYVRNPSISMLSATELLDKESTRNFLQYSQPSNPIFFIGVFSIPTDIYGYSIMPLSDTPLQSGVPSINYELNAYLNGVFNAFFQRSSIVLISFINLLIAFLVVDYYQKYEMIKVKSSYLIAIELLVVVSLFLIFLFVLYWFWHIKYPFVVTVVMLVISQRFYHHFLNFF